MSTRFPSKATVLLVVVVLACAFLPVAASGIGFIKFHGINGPSTDPGHMGWIDIIETSWGNRRLSKRATEVGLTLTFGPASPQIAEATANGKVFPEVLIEQVVSGKGSGKSVVYRLGNVVITSYSFQGSAAGGAPVEKIILRYQNVSRLR